MARTDEAARRRAVRTRRIEAMGLGLLAFLPAVPYATFFLRSSVPRFGLLGERALLEVAVRHVWTGDTLLGAPSAFGWNQPGPLFAILAALLEPLFRGASTGLYLATTLTSGGSAAALVASARLFGRRSHAIAALLVVLAWLFAFGNVTADPWSPLVVVSPTMTFLVASAMFARGKVNAVFPVVLFGSLALQTHLAVGPTVLVSALAASVAFLVQRKRAQALGPDRAAPWLEPTEVVRILGGLLLLVTLSVPPLVDQTSASHNLSKLWSFFVHRTTPSIPVALAVQHWTTATAWLPERVLHCTMLREGPPPFVVAGPPLPEGVSDHAKAIAIVHVVAVAVAALLATRRRDVTSMALLGFGALGNAIAIVSLSAVVPPAPVVLVLWTTAASSVGWMGVFATLFAAFGAFVQSRPRFGNVLAPALVVVGLGAAVASTSMQRFWLARNPIAPSTHPELRADLRALETALRQRLEREGSVAVVHRLGAHDLADAIVLELDRDGVDVRVAREDASVYVGLRRSSDPKRPLHVWAQASTATIPIAPCLELVARSGALALFGAAAVPVSCPESK